MTSKTILLIIIHLLLLFSTLALDHHATSQVCTMKSIAQVLPKTSRHWVGDGFHVRPVFGTLAFSKIMSPFLMLDYANEQFEPNNNPHQRKGVGKHPHRGFETVTVAFQGEIEHKDSVGNSDVIKSGDVQWMTAGRGIIHEEFHGINWAKTGGTVEMVQLWVNLQSKDKMVAPRYQPLSNTSIPKVELDGNGNSVRIIAGKYGDIEGPAVTYSEMNVWDIALNGSTSEEENIIELNVPENHNTMLLVRSGSIRLLDDKGTTSKVGNQQVCLFEMDGGNAIRIQAMQKSQVLLLSGVPFFDEPIANMGPFVMNTREELREAQRDYQNGNFGT